MTETRVLSLPLLSSFHKSPKQNINISLFLLSYNTPLWESKWRRKRGQSFWHSSFQSTSHSSRLWEEEKGEKESKEEERFDYIPCWWYYCLSAGKSGRWFSRYVSLSRVSKTETNYPRHAWYPPSRGESDGLHIRSRFRFVPRRLLETWLGALQAVSGYQQQIQETRNSPRLKIRSWRVFSGHVWIQYASHINLESELLRLYAKTLFCQA